MIVAEVEEASVVCKDRDFSTRSSPLILLLGVMIYKHKYVIDT